MKKCAKCGIEKDIDKFSKNPQQVDGKHCYCKDCVRAYSQNYYKEHREQLILRERERHFLDPEKHKRYHREYRINFPDKIRNKHLLKKYGISLKDWNILFISQHSRCAICLTDDPGIKNWNTDHDHSTNRVRGILCTSCNNGLGRFKDNPEFLKRAANYLLRKDCED